MLPLDAKSSILALSMLLNALFVLDRLPVSSLPADDGTASWRGRRLGALA